MTDIQRKRVVVYGDGDRADVSHAISQFLPLLREKADEVAVCTDRSLDLAEVDFDLLINFGGDGSLLGAVRSMGANQVPIVGVNFGKIGFLALFELPQLYTSLDDLLAGSLRKRECIMLEGTVTGPNGTSQPAIAVNDAVISRGTFSRIVKLQSFIDGYPVSSYHADGIIVSTPAGSTAHSLSAGGPILEPEMNAMILTVICPHTLALRPLVVAGDRTIELEILEAQGEVGVTFDGQKYLPMNPGDRLTIKKYEHRFALVVGKGPGFYDNLRAKFLWGGHVEHFRQDHRDEVQRF